MCKGGAFFLLYPATVTLRLVNMAGSTWEVPN
jgi:hypothetical protein